MDWSKYQLRLVESYEGEDSLGNDVSGHSEYFCPVANLREGEPVEWDRNRNGYPAISCKAIGDESVIFDFTNYFNPYDRLSETREVSLSPAHPSWGHSLGGGRYDHHYELFLVSAE